MLRCLSINVYIIMYSMKRILIMSITLLLVVVAAAAEHDFNPRRFQADMETFIVKEAGLTPAQIDKFLPLFREMQTKQRALFDEMRQYRRMADFGDDNACARAIHRMDNIDVQIRRIQQQYHSKFLAVLPGRVVMKILRAEDCFYRQAFRRAARCPRAPREK